ncbi:MAG: alginate export family protein [Pseudomonadota bacterium]
MFRKNIMTTFRLSTVAAALLASSVGTVNTVSAADTLVDAIKGGSYKLNFRLRYEDVNLDGGNDASAFTLRSRLTLKTATYQGLGALVEFDNVKALSDVDYTDGVTVRGTAPIADPEGTEVNQAYLSWTGGGNTAKFGRQRILLDNQRFVGGVGFRQNEQTYDAVSVTSKAFEKTNLFYAYVFNVNRIFGEDTPAGDHESNTHLLNVSYAGLPIGKLTAYAYLLDNEDLARFSTNTFGVRLAGSQKVSEDLKIMYTAEFAKQSDAADNALNYDANYYVLEGGASFSGITAKVGYEVLGSDGGAAAFITPLATLHKFQGFVDRFLVTPAAGVQDLYFQVGGKVGPVNLQVFYHNYEAEEGSAEYGSEWSFLAAWKIDKNFGLSLKYSDYNADEFSTDLSKLWLTATAVF